MHKIIDIIQKNLPQNRAPQKKHVVHIRFSFLLVAVVFMLLGKWNTLLMLLAAVTLHELSHVLLACRFGCTVARFSFTALGEIAVIHKMDMLRAWQRNAILSAGPLCNAVLAAAAYGTGKWLLPEITFLPTFALYNFALCLFNLLPAYPLDGAKIMQNIFGSLTGVLPANRLLVRISRITGVWLVLMGIIQVVLYPYNISLICMGMYILQCNSHSKLQMTYEFFQSLLNKPTQLNAKGILPVKMLYAQTDYALSRIVDHFSRDSITAVMLAGQENILIMETEIVTYIVQFGMGGSIGEAAAYLRGI